MCSEGTANCVHHEVACACKVGQWSEFHKGAGYEGFQWHGGSHYWSDAVSVRWEWLSSIEIVWGCEGRQAGLYIWKHYILSGLHWLVGECYDELCGLARWKDRRRKLRLVMVQETNYRHHYDRPRISFSAAHRIGLYKERKQHNCHREVGGFTERDISRHMTLFIPGSGPIVEEADLSRQPRSCWQAKFANDYKWWRLQAVLGLEVDSTIHHSSWDV